MTPLEEIVCAIQAANSIALVSHVNPDGDAIGSALALKLGLEGLGKTVVPFCRDKVPDNLMFLKGASDYRRPEDMPDARFDLLLCADVSDELRMGTCAVLTERCAHVAQIDHHGTNPNYAEWNCVDAKAPATGLLAYDLLTRLGVAMNADIAACLYVAISTDTGNYAYASTSSKAFRITAELLEAGLPLSEIHRRLFRERAIQQVRLLQRCLSSLTFYHGGAITSMTLSRQDFADCGALPEHADTLVNYGLDIVGVRMAVLARETGVDGEIKLSLRAVEPSDISGVAKSLGGGGHAQAAGASVRGTLEECVSRCVSAFEEALENNQ